jgi:hypothetical protein
VEEELEEEEEGRTRYGGARNREGTLRCNEIKEKLGRRSADHFLLSTTSSIFFISYFGCEVLER